jgi:hypothetical protein
MYSVNAPGIKEDPFSKGGFTSVYMGADADVSDLGWIFFHYYYNLYYISFDWLFIITMPIVIWSANEFYKLIALL